MFSRSSWIHLRIPFSVFLLPIFLLALISIDHFNLTEALLVFIVWHLFIYPSSNGYNSFYDRDEGSIGLLKRPPKTTRDLLVLSFVFELLGLLAAALLDWKFGILVLVYVLASRLYSHPAVRLKKYPVTGWLITGLIQGALVFGASCYALSQEKLFTDERILGMMISTIVLWGIYPITQVYQHDEDSQRGDRTISILLGVKGTFWFSGFWLLLSGALMAYYFATYGQIRHLLIVGIGLLPFLTYFLIWFVQISKSPEKVSFERAMILNLLSSAGLITAFGLILVL